MNKKNMMILIGAIGSVAAMGTVALAIWNSKQMRLMRSMKQASRMMYQVGTALRNVSGITDN